MGEKKVVLDPIDLFSGKKIQKKVCLNLLTMQKEKKKIQSFMLEPTIKELLERDFKERGITWGAGIRMIIIGHLKQEKKVR